MIYCEMCLLDFFTSAEATTTRKNERGQTINLCETCARVEFDGLPLKKKRPAKKAKLVKKRAKA